MTRIQFQMNLQMKTQKGIPYIKQLTQRVGLPRSRFHDSCLPTFRVGTNSN